MIEHINIPTNTEDNSINYIDGYIQYAGTSSYLQGLLNNQLSSILNSEGRILQEQMPYLLKLHIQNISIQKAGEYMRDLEPKYQKNILLTCIYYLLDKKIRPDSDK